MTALEGFDRQVAAARQQVEQGNRRAAAALLENEALALRALDRRQIEGSFDGDD